MGEAVELAIVLAAKDAASEILGHVGGKLDSLGKAGDIAKLALVGLTAGLGAAITAGMDFVHAAADEQKGVERMRQAITATGENWRDYSDGIEETIIKMERLTAFSDGEMRDAMSTLINETGDADEALKRLPIATDFARGAQIDLATASKLLGKVTDETVNVLGRYGIHVDKGTKATEVLALVQQKFGGQSAAYAETATGKWQIFNNQMDNLKEDIGSALLPAFSALGDVATGVIDGLRKTFADLQDAGVIDAIAKTLGTVKDVAVELFGVITGTAPGAGAALTNAIGSGPAKIIMEALALVRDTFKAIIAGDLPAIFENAKSRIPVIIEGLLGFLKGAVPKILDVLLAWGKEFVAFVVKTVPPMLSELMHLLSQMIGWLGDHAEEIGKTLVQWGLKFGEFLVTTALPALIQNLPPLLLAIGTWVLTEAIPGVIRIFIGLGKGIVSGILEGLGELKTSIWNALVAAFSGIDFWVGPFHVTSGGISVQMPELHFPGFAEGGIVPGPRGAPLLAVVHGGEEVRTPAQQGGGTGDGGHGHDIYMDGALVARATGKRAYRGYRMVGGRV